MSESTRRGRKYTRDQLGEKISNAIKSNKYGSGIEPNVRGIMKDIKNDDITDLYPSGYFEPWGSPIPLSNGGHISITGEGSGSRAGDRACQYVPGMIDPKRIKKFSCPSRSDILP